MSAQRNLTIAINVNAGQAVQAISSIKGALQGLQTQQAKSNKATQQGTETVVEQVDQFKDWQTAIDRARRNAYSMTIAGYQLAASGRAVVGSLQQTVKVAGDVDYAIRRAATTLEILDDSSLIFKQLTASITESAIAAKLFDAEEVARGYYYWGSTTGQVAKSQADLAAIRQSMMPIMQAAAITETQLQTAMKGTLSILQQFALPYGRAADVTEKLFYVTQKTANEYPDLIEAFKMVGPVANQMNVSFEETLVMLGKLGDVGIKGTTAGRSLRQVFRQLSRETPIATNALNEATNAVYGMNTTFKDLVFPEGKFAGMSNFLSVLYNITKNMTDAQKGHLFSIIATAAEMPTLIQLVKLQGEAMERNTTIFEDAQDKLDFNEAARVFKESWDIIQNSIKAVIGELKQKLQPIVVTIGRTFVEVFKPVAAVIGDAALALNAWAQANPEIFRMAVAGVAATGALSLLGGVVLLLTGGIRLLAGAVLPQFILEMLKSASATGVATASVEAFTAAQASSSITTRRNIGHLLVYAATLGKVNLAAKGSAAGLFAVDTAMTAQAGKVSILSRGWAAVASAGTHIASAAVGVGKFVASMARLVPVAGIIAFVAGTLFGLFKTLGSGTGGLAGGPIAGLLSVLGSIASVLFKVGQLLTNVVMLFMKGGQAVGHLTGRLINFLGTVPGFQQLGEAIGFVGDVLRNTLGFIGGLIDGMNSFFDMLFKNADEAMRQYDLSRMSEEQRRAIEQGRSLEEQAYTDMEDRRVAAFTKMNEKTRQLAELGVSGFYDEYMESLAEGSATVDETLDATLVNPFGMKMKEIEAQARATGEAIPGLLAGNVDASALAAHFQPMVDAALSVLNDPNAKAKARQAAAETMFSFVDEFYHSGATDIPPAAAGIVDFAIAAVQSKNPDMRRVGFGAMTSMANGYLDGGASSVGPAVASILNAANTLIQSNNPNSKKLGFNMMANLALGMANNEPNKATKAVLMAAYRMLASGNPAMQAQGYNTMVAYANGLAKGSPMVGSILRKMIGNLVQSFMAAGMPADVAKRLAEARFNTVVAGFNYMNVPGLSSFKPNFDGSQYDIPSLGGGGGLFTGGGGGGSSSGGGGSKSGGGSGSKTSKEESPLQNALNVAEQGARLYEALRKIEGVNLQSLVKKTMDGVAKGVNAAILVAHTYAKKVDKKTLQKVAEWATVAEQVAGLVGTAVTAFKDLGQYKNVANSQFKSIVADMAQAISAMMYHGKRFKAKDLVVAMDFADAASTVVQAVATGFTSFTSIGKYTKVSRTVLKQIARDMVAAVVILGKTMGDVKQALVTKAAEFADGAGSVVQAFAETFESFKDLNSYQKPLPSVLRSIRESMVDAIKQLVMASNQFTFSDAQYTKLTNFAVLTEKVMGAFNLTWQTFNQDIQKVDEWRVRPDIGRVFTDIKSTVAGFDAIAKLYSAERITKIGQLAETASGIAGAIEAFFGIGKNVSQDPGTLSRMVAEALGAISYVVAKFAASFQPAGADIIKRFVAGVKSQESLLSAEMERVGSILDGTLVVGNIVVTGDSANLTITHVIKDPDGALRTASSEEVAAILSGSTYISNLVSSTRTQ